MDKTIAVDFDGCLCEKAWPGIGQANEELIDELIMLRRIGVKVILNTCREGDMLSEAVNWCYHRGLDFDAVNENLPDRIEAFGGDCRKISADEYWDDKAVLVQYEDSPDTAATRDVAILGTIYGKYARRALDSDNGLMWEITESLSKAVLDILKGVRENKYDMDNGSSLAAEENHIINASVEQIRSLRNPLSSDMG